MRFLFILMTLWACFGCARSFDTSKGLEIHRRSCKSFSSTTRNLLKRSQQQEQLDATKVPRKELEVTDARSMQGSHTSHRERNVLNVPVRLTILFFHVLTLELRMSL